jgi:hypothetical protein
VGGAVIPRPGTTLLPAHLHHPKEKGGMSLSYFVVDRQPLNHMATFLPTTVLCLVHNKITSFLRIKVVIRQYLFGNICGPAHWPCLRIKVVIQQISLMHLLDFAIKIDRFVLMIGIAQIKTGISSN